jgi:hypothetical protein
MTEVGYRSIDGTAINPGSWTSKAPADLAEQADAYNAFFQVWSAHGGSWLKGVEFWQWDLNNFYSRPAIRSWTSRPQDRGGAIFPWDRQRRASISSRARRSAT